jgi:hypothetical protein
VTTRKEALLRALLLERFGPRPRRKRAEPSRAEPEGAALEEVRAERRRVLLEGEHPRVPESTREGEEG